MRRFNRSQIWTLCPALAVLLLTAVLSLRNWVEFQDSHAAELSSREMLARANRLLSLVQDAETGQRGYLLTGNNLYLDPYARALPEIRSELSALTPQRRNTTLAHLRDAVNNKLDELAETVRLRRNGDLARAMALVQTGAGKETMDRIRVLVAQLVAEEVEISGDRSELAQSHANNLAIVGTAGSLLTCVLLFLAMMRLTTLRKREWDARNLLASTLASIGDAVITTDNRGAVTFLNAIAEKLTGWPSSEAAGQKLENVFRIVNQQTGERVENPAERVLREGCIVGLANHTLLLSRDGSECPIDDSGAPIRDCDSNISGVVLVFRDVAERYRSESTLAASEQRHRMLFENNPQPMWIFDEQTLAFLDVNRAAVEHYGYTREEFLSMTLRDIRPAEELPSLLADLAKHRSTRHSDGPWLHRKKDGSQIAVEITVVPVEFNGRAAKFASTTDVSARIAAEKALRHSEQEYRAIVETASDAIITIDEQSNICFASPPIERIFGYDPKTLRGRPLTDLMPEPMRAAHLAGFRRYLQTGQRHAAWQLLELPGLRADGCEVPLEISFGEFRSEDRRWFTGVIRDASERKLAREQLLETRKLMQTVFNAVPLAIWGIDLLGRVIFWNRAAEDMFLWTEAEVRERPLPIIPDDQQEEFQSLLGEYATGRELSGVERSRLRKDGSLIRCAIWTAPLHTASGSINGTVGILADVTERKRAEREVRDHLHYLARVQRDLEQFAWAASHELAEPIRLTAAAAEQLDRVNLSYLPNAVQKAVFETRTAALRAETFVDALRDYWEVQHKTLVARNLSLDAVVSLAVQNLHDVISAAGASVNWHDLPQFTGDHDLLVQLFTQLIGNAVKFRSSAPPRIQISAEKTDGGFTVRVQDNGIGMDSRHADRAFRIFHKLAPDQPGAGIGLSLARQIMERHGGSISIASEPGAGMTVYLEFAISKNVDSALEFRSSAAAASPSRAK